ncbi:unnamed protein product [Closterium sp. Yama58-4]|nr:unnamed protein product [Closterium sp. Yama58-4]
MRVSSPFLRALASPHSPFASAIIASAPALRPPAPFFRPSAPFLRPSAAPAVSAFHGIPPARAAASLAIAAATPATMISLQEEKIALARAHANFGWVILPPFHPLLTAAPPEMQGRDIRNGHRLARGGDCSEPLALHTLTHSPSLPPHPNTPFPLQRLQGKEVTFVTGTDEHGEKIALAAAKNGRTPQEHCDAVAAEYKQLWSKLDIAYDRFIRTTSPRHEAVVRQFYDRVKARGDVYRAQYEGRYCIACEEYKDEKELVDGTTCPTHLTPCEHRSEDNLFFALSSHQHDLEKIFQDRPDFVQPSFRKNEVLAWVAEGARDFSISRAAVAWGIPVPDVPEQTIYVWFDALLGYISALLEEGDEPSLDTAVSRGWPASVHIIGKDILRFHAVYWPAMLMSAGLPTPTTVFGHGFLTKDGHKMGKSLGNTIDPDELVTTFGADAVRYFFLREIEFGSDGDFSKERFVNIVNANLANTIGNLVNRTLGLLKKNCNSTLSIDSAALPLDHPLRTTTATSMETAAACYVALDFSGACEAILAPAAAGNGFLEERAPWSRFKRGGAEAEEAATDLVAVLETARCVAVALSPITPTLARSIYTQLGFTAEQFSAIQWADTHWGGLNAGQQTAEPAPVFARIEQEEEGCELMWWNVHWSLWVE